MRNRISRRQRRRIEAAANVTVHPLHDVDMRRHPSSQALGGSAARPVVPGAPRRGLVRRAKAYLARRYVDKLGTAVVPTLVAGAVVLVAVGLIVGVVVGAVLAANTTRRVPGEW